MTVVVFWIKEEAQRHFEHLIDLARVGFHREGRFYDTDDRSDPETGTGNIVFQLAYDIDVVARQSYFFFGFPKGGVDWFFIAILYMAAGEANLPGMFG